MTLCQHCGYAPARADRGGYCSWDCHDHAYPACDAAAHRAATVVAARAPRPGVGPVAATAGAA